MELLFLTYSGPLLHFFWTFSYLFCVYLSVSVLSNRILEKHFRGFAFLCGWCLIKPLVFLSQPSSWCGKCFFYSSSLTSKYCSTQQKSLSTIFLLQSKSLFSLFSQERNKTLSSVLFLSQKFWNLLTFFCVLMFFEFLSFFFFFLTDCRNISAFSDYSWYRTKFFSASFLERERKLCQVYFCRRNFEIF